MFKRNTKPAVLSLATAILLQPLLAWATENCYNYNPCRDCMRNTDCETHPVDEPVIYCKQLTAPFSDPGCCQYKKQHFTFGTIDQGNCPCDNGQTYTVITNAVHNAALLCKTESGTIAPCNTDVQGSCVYDPDHSCQ